MIIAQKAISCNNKATFLYEKQKNDATIKATVFHKEAAMKEQIINQHWYFHIEDEDFRKTGDPDRRDELTTFGFTKPGEAVGFAARRYENPAWRTVSLPHDYGVELPYNKQCHSFNGLKPINESLPLERDSLLGRTDTPTFPIAWYRKHFFMTEDGCFLDEERAVYGRADTPAPQGKRYFLRFEGVYRDFTVWVNGVYIDRALSGYLGVTLDITDQLIFGESNSIAVRVDCSQYEGWWYDGGGIYRDVKLLTTNDCYCMPADIYVHTAKNGQISITADVTNKGEQKTAKMALIIEKDGAPLLKAEKSLALTGEKTAFSAQLQIHSPALWDVDDPQLYTLTVLLNGERETEIPFGFKDVRFDPEHGFFLNGKARTLNGVCLHQDLAGVGVALPYELTYYKLKVMKEMGVNAIRCSHNPPSPDVLTVCDRLGILLMDETRMFGSTPEALRQLETLIRRDRNHACLLMWSIGNEEGCLQGSEWGARMARTVCRTIRQLTADPIITFGGNNGNEYHGINEVMPVRGINYIRICQDPDDYHRAHPHQPIISSEELSSLATRGVYKNDPTRGYVDGYGNNTMPWASTPMGYVKFCLNRPYYCGGFAWTGYDYRGEPIPYAGSILDENEMRNTVGNFGIVDLCGFPKDVYYYYRANWRKEILLHLLPSWNNYAPGERVRVVAFTNCEEVTLYLNGREIAREKNEPGGCPEWYVPFEAGELKAVGRRGEETVTAVRRTAEAADLRLTAETIGDYTMVTVDAVDAYGACCDIDDSMLEVSCEGATVIGAGNGDPAAHLRESFYEESETRALPSFHFTPAPIRHRPFYMEPAEKEEANPHFYDAYRLLWPHPASTGTDRTVSVEFEADESDRYVEFPAIVGDAVISLNGRELGRVSVGSLHCMSRKRAYRFPASFQKGKNTLAVTIRDDTGYPVVLTDAVIGKPVFPAVCYPLFRGKLLLILRGKGKLTVQAADGRRATAQIG
jgi:beta-galactosidase